MNLYRLLQKISILISVILTEISYYFYSHFVSRIVFNKQWIDESCDADN